MYIEEISNTIETNSFTPFVLFSVVVCTFSYIRIYVLRSVPVLHPIRLASDRLEFLIYSMYVTFVRVFLHVDREIFSHC